jgi:hypothetical protein
MQPSYWLKFDLRAHSFVHIVDALQDPLAICSIKKWKVDLTLELGQLFIFD